MCWRCDIAGIPDIHWPGHGKESICKFRAHVGQIPSQSHEEGAWGLAPLTTSLHFTAEINKVHALEVSGFNLRTGKAALDLIGDRTSDTEAEFNYQLPRGAT